MQVEREEKADAEVVRQQQARAQEEAQRRKDKAAERKKKLAQKRKAQAAELKAQDAAAKTQVSANSTRNLCCNLPLCIYLISQGCQHSNCLTQHVCTCGHC